MTSTRQLVDAELLPMLDTIPLRELSAEILPQMRTSMKGYTAPAPAAPDTEVVERFIPVPGGPSLRVLVYTPKMPRRTGALLWLHGGGMVQGTPNQNEPQSRYLAQLAGCVVVAPQYRLAPENPYPAGLDDCFAALQWLPLQAEELNFPREKIAVAGESGGGCLAAGLTLWARDRGPYLNSALFLQNPMLDDRTGTPAEPAPMPQKGEFVWTRNSEHFAWTSVLGKRPGSADVPVYAAPGRAVELAGFPPTFLLVGDLDLFVGETLRFAQTLLRDNVPTELHVYPGVYHGFTFQAR